MEDVERPVTERPDAERDRMAEQLAARLDVPLTVLGVVFALLVLAETVSRPTGWVSTAFQVLSWALWVVFVGEFLLRLFIAPSRGRFLRRNGWQLVFLAVPFLRFLRVARLARFVRVSRIARLGRIVSSAVRGTRTAGKQLRGRLAWLVVVTAIVVLGSSQVLFELGAYDSYPQALRAALLAATAGEPMTVEGPLQLLEVALVIFSVVVFAALAGSIGAFFLERDGPGAEPERPRAEPAGAAEPPAHRLTAVEGERSGRGATGR